MKINLIKEIPIEEVKFIPQIYELIKGNGNKYYYISYNFTQYYILGFIPIKECLNLYRINPRNLEFYRTKDKKTGHEVSFDSKEEALTYGNIELTKYILNYISNKTLSYKKI